MYRLAQYGIAAVLVAACLQQAVLAEIGSAEAATKEVMRDETPEKLFDAAPPIDDAIRQHLQDRDYGRALEAIHAAMAEDGAPLDYLTYLRGRALFLQEEYAKAVQVFRLLDTSFPDSPWRRRARFDAAQAYARQGDFKAAEGIYRREAEHLFGPVRRQQIADIYLEFADAASQPEDDRAEPDYRKALEFYLAALDLGLKVERRAEIEMLVAQCHQALDDTSTAADEYAVFIESYPDNTLVIEARFRLGECQLARDKPAEARRSWQDLLETHGDSDSPRIAEASFRLAETWGIPEPVNDVALDLGVATLHSFLERFPKHEDAAKAHLQIAESLVYRKRYGDAVDCLKGFLEQEQFASSEQTPEARDLLGQSYQLQKKYDDAIRVWREFLMEHTAHERWNEVQQEIIRTEYLRAADHYEREEFDKARELFTKFLAQYPLDARCSSILLLFGEMAFREKKWDNAIAAWKRLVSKYPETHNAGEAQFKIAQTLEQELGRFKEALEAYEAVKHGAKVGEARQAILRLKEKHLAVITERVFRTDEPARIKLSTRNIESVTVRVYPIDMETYFRKMHKAPGVEQLDIALIDPDATIEFEVPDYEAYREFDSMIELPFEGNLPGVMAVTVNSRRFEATTQVIRSDLDVIVKSSRDEVFVFAENMLTGKAWPSVKLLISDGKTLLAEGETGEDGVYHQGFSQLSDASDVRVFAMLGDHVASNAVELKGLQIAQGLEDEGYLYTDRPAYRAGEEVHVRGWIRRVQGDKYVVDEGRKCTLEVVDVRNRKLREKEVVLGRFGTLDDSFALLATSPLGEYRLLVRDEDDRTYSGIFLVQEYKPEPVRLIVDSPRRVYYRGETIEGTIRVEHYYGAPVVGKEVRYALDDDESHTATTDDEGLVPFSFPTREYHEAQLLQLQASLPLLNLDTSTNFYLATQGYSIELSTSRPLFLSGEPFEVTAKTVTPDGKPVGRLLTLKVFERTTVAGRIGERMIESHEIETGEDDGVGRVTLALKEGGEYVLRAEGTDRFDNPVSGWTRMTISGEEDEIRLRILADRHTYKAGDKADVVLHWRGGPTLALVTFQGAKILDHRLVELTTGRNTLPIVFDADLAPNFELAVALMSDGDRKAEVFTQAKRFHEANAPFTVERELVVQMECRRTDDGQESVQPGDQLEVTLTTADPQGNPVPAEVSLAMVEQSLLDRFEWLAPDVSTVFRGNPRKPQVRTESSICFEYRPETVDVNPRLLSEQERIEIAREEAESRRLAARQYESGGLGGGLGGEYSEEYGGYGGYGGEYGGYGDTTGGYAGGMMGGMMGGMGGMGMASDDPFGGAPRARAEDPFGGIPSDDPFGTPAEETEVTVSFYDMDVADQSGVQKVVESMPSEAKPSREAESAAYWNPTIVTDENGRATVTISVPESSTAWRLLAKGITMDSLVGETDEALVVKKDLFGQMRLPLAFTDGDKVDIPVSVYHDASAEASAEVTLKTTIGGRAVEETQTVELGKKRITEIAFRREFHLPKIEEVDEAASGAARSQIEFELTVKSGDRSDRVRRSIPLLPYGTTVAVSRGGSATGDTSTWLEPAESMPMTTPSLQILVGPTVERSLLDAVLGEPRLVHGDPFASCSATERLAADLMAGLALQNLLTKTRASGRPEMLELDRRIRSAIASLMTTQKGDGGWSWTGADNPADRNTTSYVVWALSLARDAGFRVPDKAYHQAVQHVRDRITTTDSTDYTGKAVLLHAATIAGHSDFNLANRLYRVRADLSTSALLHLALTFAAMERSEMAKELLKLFAENNLDVDSHGSAVEFRALYALALQQISPSSREVERSIDWLLANCSGQRWSPDVATGPAVTALCLWFGSNRFETEGYKLDVFVNDTKVRTLEIDFSSPTEVIEVPATLVVKGRQKIRFQMTGRGRYSYQCQLSGFVPADKLHSTTDAWLARRVYEPALLEVEGRPIARGFNIVQGKYKTFRNPVTQLPVGRRAIVLLGVQRRNRLESVSQSAEYLVVHETIPNGTEVVADSVTGPFEHYEIVPGGITFYLGDQLELGTIRYELHGTLPGEYRAAPTMIRNAYRPGEMVVANAMPLTVLPAGEKSSDAYRLSPMELFDLGQHFYGERQYEQAAKHLGDLFANWTLRPGVYQNVARMLLDIHLELGPPEEIVRYFEVLIERWPEEEISFEKVLKIGAAYEQMGEFERGYLAFRGTVEGRFMRELGVAGFLESQDEFLRSVAYTQRLLQEYPSEGYAAVAAYSLAQRIYSKASEAAESERLRAKKITRIDLIRHAAEMLDGFLTVFPTDPAADRAAFARANALLEMEAYDAAVAACNRYADRYPNSDLLDSFWYLIGYCHFAAGRSDEALTMCRKVSEATRVDKSTGRQGEARNKWLAIYILGQIYHSLDQPEKAIEQYRRVEDRFDDALASIEDFQRQRIALPELTTVVPGKPVELDLKFRNLASCDIKVYRIDLMKFGLLQGNLGAISQVNLAGVRPRHEERVDLGTGQDYRDRTHQLILPLEEEGAYLVVCRDANVHTSGLVLVSPLSLQVHQDLQSGQVRATVKNLAEDRCERDVHVKVIGSGNMDFVSGTTDLRGIFVAEGIQGSATVIALVEPSRYALHRGTSGGALPVVAGPLTPVAAQTIALAASEAGVSLDSSEAEERIVAVLKSPTAISFDNEPLSHAASQLSRAHGINIQIDGRALEDINMEIDTPITLNLAGVSLKSALRRMLADLDLTYVIRDEVLLITTPEEAEMQLATKLYPVTDLVKFKDSSGEAWADYDSLISLLTATVQPECWGDVGGPGAIGPMSLPGKEVLAIRQTEEVHDEIANLLARLRGMAQPREDGELPVRERNTMPSDYGSIDGMEYGGMGGFGGGGGGGLGGGGTGGLIGGRGLPARQGTDLLEGLQNTNRTLQGEQAKQLEKMYEEGGKGGRGAGFF